MNKYLKTIIIKTIQDISNYIQTSSLKRFPISKEINRKISRMPMVALWKMEKKLNEPSFSYPKYKRWS